jgi:hypothetical protein
VFTRSCIVSVDRNIVFIFHIFQYDFRGPCVQDCEEVVKPNIETIIVFTDG